jgi:predicted aspartyl protease
LNIRIQRGLPFVRALLTQNGKSLLLDQVLLDTGSETSVFSSDELAEIGVRAELEDVLHRTIGVGGFEYTFSKRLDAVALGTAELRDFEIQVGAMDYGFPVQGILGIDFLLRTRAVIDLDRLELFESR